MTVFIIVVHSFSLCFISNAQLTPRLFVHRVLNTISRVLTSIREDTATVHLKKVAARVENGADMTAGLQRSGREGPASNHLGPAPQQVPHIPPPVPVISLIVSKTPPTSAACVSPTAACPTATRPDGGGAGGGGRHHKDLL